MYLFIMYKFIEIFESNFIAHIIFSSTTPQPMGDPCGKPELVGGFALHELVVQPLVGVFNVGCDLFAVRQTESGMGG